MLPLGLLSDIINVLIFKFLLAHLFIYLLIYLKKQNITRLKKKHLIKAEQGKPTEGKEPLKQEQESEIHSGVPQQY